MSTKSFARTLVLLLVFAIGYFLREQAADTDAPEATAPSAQNQQPSQQRLPHEAAPSGQSQRGNPLEHARSTMRQARELREARETQLSEEAPKAREKKPGSTRKSQLPLWSSTRTLTAKENAEAHWKKHRREFPEYRSAQEYIEGAHQFLRGPPPGTEEKTRPNGDRLLYHAASNTFAVQARNGAPRTMFRPNNGQRYWSRQ